MIGIGCDHGALELKEAVKKHLEDRGLAYKDFGCYDKNSCDYPDYSKYVSQAVSRGECDRGIVMCTTGIGVFMAANKVDGIRCALLHDKVSAKLSREQFDCNVMALGAAVVGQMLALEIVDVWLDTPFADTAENRRCLEKMTELEK